MNILKLHEGVYRLTKPISNPYPNKKRPHDWRCQEEFPLNDLYFVIFTLRRRSETKKIGHKLVDHMDLTIKVQDSSPGIGKCGAIEFRFFVNWPSGDKPRISNIVIPDGCDPVPLDFLCALKPDYSAKAFLSMLRCCNFKQDEFSYLALLDVLSQMGKITAADIRDALLILRPGWPNFQCDEVKNWKF